MRAATCGPAATSPRASGRAGGTCARSRSRGRTEGKWARRTYTHQQARSRCASSSTPTPRASARADEHHQRQEEGPDRRSRPLHRRAHGDLGPAARGDALRLPGPLVVLARGGGAVRVHRPDRDRYLHLAVLRPEHGADDLPRSLQAARRADDERRLPVGDLPELPGQGGAPDAPDPPLGGRRVHRRDRRAPDAGVLHRRVPQAARADVDDRPAPAVHLVPRGVHGLLAGRRSALRDRVADRLRRWAVGADHRRAADVADLRGAVPGAQPVLLPDVHRARVPCAAAAGDADRRAPGAVAARHHTQFKESERTTNKRIVGAPLFPAQAPRSLALMFFTVGVLFLLGGLVQINPVWQWGPFHEWASENGAQPDWYLGWLIGALRLMPSVDVTIGHFTLFPNPVWGGVFFPGIVLMVLVAFPWVEARLTGDHGVHNLAQRPREAPNRTAFGVAFLAWVFLIFVFGAADRVYVLVGLGYQTLLLIFHIAIWVVPIVLFFITRMICRNLLASDIAAAAREQAEHEAIEHARALAGARSRPG